MTEERFEKYVNQIVPNKSSDEYLRENKEYIKSLKKSREINKEMNYYKALSNELRFFIYKLLQERPMCTCALARIFDKKDNIINHHLSILESYGMIKGEKAGYFTIYKVIT